MSDDRPASYVSQEPSVHESRDGREVAFADPEPVVPTQLAGDWSTYSYNGGIYESDITRGLLVWNLTGEWEAGARKLPYLNPQTSEFTLRSPKRHHGH